MPNVRVAQIGQTGLNRPIFEVVHETRRYVMTGDETGRVRLRTRQFLKSIGVFSSVANKFSDEPTPAFATELKFASDQSTTLDDRFNVQSLGSGLKFVSDFTPDKGWTNLNPVFSRTF